jgi:hypothetical protein
MRPRASAIVAPKGAIGFDANATVTFAQARAFHAAGYRYALRYIPRLVARASDLSVDEVDNILMAGLALMPVQHVESESSWTPTEDRGRAYGDRAATRCHELGISIGTTVWLDLEGVCVGTDPAQVIAYCRAWHAAVTNGGFQPGLYVGWHSGLTPNELYALPFTRYWAAYNLNGDEYPATCGVCMRQHSAAPSDKPASIPFEIDTDVVLGDKLERFPTVYAPDEWSGL